MKLYWKLQRRSIVLSCAVAVVAIGNVNLAIAETATADSVLTSSKAIVVTAQRHETAVDSLGSSITVITAKEIEKKGQPTVLELLRAVPGVAVIQNGGMGGTSSVFIRGAESDHTLVLIDGIRVNDSNSGQFSFADLKTENIERIEVLRGPQSVLYGSEAIGGVINILTKKAEQGLRSKLTLGGGSHSTQDYSGYVSYGNDKVKSSNSIAYYQTEGFSVAQEDNGNSEDDSYRNISFSSGNRVALGTNGFIDVNLGFTRADKEIDDFDFTLGAVDNLDYEQEREFLTSSIIVSKPINSWITPRLELGLNQDNIKGKDPVVDFNNFDIDNQNSTVTGEFDFEASQETLATIGYSYEHRAGDSKGNFDESRNVDSAYFHVEQQVFERLKLTGGVRHDEDSQFGGETTYRVTAVVPSDDTGTRVHASWGTSFKAPAFNELYFPDFGNPDLRPEKSRGYDVGVEQAFFNGKVVADITYFENDIDDLIGFDSVTFLSENVEEAEVRGVESSASLSLIEDLLADVRYTYTDSEDKATGALLARRPRHTGAFSLYATPTEKLGATLSVLLVNDRVESDGMELDDYTRVDVASSYAITDSIKSFVRVENLFDTDYEEVAGYGTPGLVAFAGVSFSS